MFSFNKDLPNKLTMLRLYSIPFLVVFILMFSDGFFSRAFATVVFIVVAFTDFFDGYFARKFAVESEFGKCFDNIADKALVISLLFVLVFQKRADVLPCIAIGLREVVISGIREFLGNKQATLDVSYLAKWKTTLQLIAIGVLIASKPYGFLQNIGTLVLWVSSIVTLITMRDYIRSSIKYFN